MAKEKVQSVPDVMLADTPMEEREQILRDSCDQIVEKFYTRKFGEDEKNELLKELGTGMKEGIKKMKE